MQRRLRALALLALVACKKSSVERPPPPEPPTVPAPVDAGPEPKPLSFALVTALPPGMEARVFMLADGVAVVGSTDTAMSIFALPSREDATPTNVTGRVPLQLGDPIRHVGGTVDELWFGTERRPTYHVKRGTPPKLLPRRHRIVGELRLGQWVGLESHAKTNGIFEEEPVKLEVLAGAGPVPKVDPDERIHDLVFLGGGRMCARAIRAHDEWHSVWFSEPDGRTGLVPIPTGHFAGISHVARDADGECLLVLSPFGKEGITQFQRFRDGKLGPPIEVTTRSEDWTFGMDGSMWQSTRSELIERIKLVGEHLEREVFTVEGGDCAAPSTNGVFPRTETDVWVTAACGDGRLGVFHSGPPRPAARKPWAWPPF